MNLLAELIHDKLKRKFPHLTPQVIDSVLKERNKILRAEEKYGPGYNRDGVVYRTSPDGTLTRHTKPNPR